MNWKKKQYRNNWITWIDVTSKTLAHFHETVTKITMKKKIPLWKRYMKIVFWR
jgi:lysozyme family protein